MSELDRALATVERVRKAFPCQGLQVEVCPDNPAWVILHRGNGPKKAMPAVEAIAYKKMLRAQARYRKLAKQRGDDAPFGD